MGGMHVVKTKIGITLSEQTIQRLEYLCKKNGLTKSQAIALAINTFVNEKYDNFYDEKGENNEDK